MTLDSTARVARCVVLGLTLVLGLATSAPAQQQFKLQATTITPPDNQWSKVLDRYAEAVKARSNGRVVIDVSYSGALGNTRETIEALKIGTVQIVLQEANQLDVYDPLAGLASYPYLIRDIAHFRKLMYETDIGRSFHDELEKKTGFKLIGFGFRGPREIASRREIKTPDDLKGLKIRIPGLKIFRATWEMLGANPVPMSPLEVYSALQQGVIDACENPLEAHVRSKYYEAAPYVVMTGHVNAYYSFIFDRATFSSYPEDVRKILIEEGEKAMVWGSEESVRLIDQYKKQLEAAGAKFVYPDIGAFEKKLAPLKDQYVAMKPWIEKFQSVR